MATSRQQQLPLHGRVFYRYRLFLALPADEQQQVLALAAFLDQSGVFRKRSAGFLRSSVEGISCDQLADVVLGYLEKKPHLFEQQRATTTTAGASAAADDTAIDNDAAATSLVANRRRKQVVWQFIDRLVLSGVLAIHNEDADPVLRLKFDDFARPDALFVPTESRHFSHGDGGVSVWSLRATALVAGSLNRAGRVSKGLGGHAAYFVLDGKTRTLYWFDSDASTQIEGHIELAGVQVQSSGPYAVSLPSFTVRVGSSLYMIGSDAAEFINPMLSCGAVYDETTLVSISKIGVVASAVVGGRGVRWIAPTQIVLALGQQ